MPSPSTVPPIAPTHTAAHNLLAPPPGDYLAASSVTHRTTPQQLRYVHLPLHSQRIAVTHRRLVHAAAFLCRRLSAAAFAQRYRRRLLSLRCSLLSVIPQLRPPSCAPPCTLTCRLPLSPSLPALEHTINLLAWALAWHSCGSSSWQQHGTAHGMQHAMAAGCHYTPQEPLFLELGQSTRTGWQVSQTSLKEEGRAFYSCCATSYSLLTHTCTLDIAIRLVHHRNTIAAPHGSHNIANNAHRASWPSHRACGLHHINIL